MNQAVIEIPSDLPSFLTGLSEEEIRIAQILDQEFERVGKKTAKLVIQYGKIMTEMKAILGHGNFGQWLKAKNISDDTATRSMRVAQEFGDMPETAQLFVPSVLYLLSAASFPEAAKQEIINRASNGQIISIEEVKAAKRSYQRRGSSPSGGGSGGSGGRSGGSGGGSDTQKQTRRTIDRSAFGELKQQLSEPNIETEIGRDRTGEIIVVSLPGKTLFYESTDALQKAIPLIKKRVSVTSSNKVCSDCQFCEIQGESWHCSKFQQVYFPSENPAPKCDRFMPAIIEATVEPLIGDDLSLPVEPDKEPTKILLRLNSEISNEAIDALMSAIASATIHLNIDGFCGTVLVQPDQISFSS